MFIVKVRKLTSQIGVLRQLKCLAALKKLQQVSQLYQYDALNLLSYMKIDVKNIHSVGYHKDKLFTVLDYPMYTHTHTHIYIYIYIYTHLWTSPNYF